MANHLHYQAEDGTIIQINAQELQTDTGKKWLEDELRKHKKIAEEAHDQAINALEGKKLSK